MRIHADRNQLSKLVAVEMKYFNRRFAMSVLSSCTAIIALLTILLSLFSYVSTAADPVNRTYLNLSIGLAIALIAAYFTYRIIKWDECASYSLVMSFTAFNFFACAVGGFMLSRPVWLNEIQHAHAQGFSIYFENVLQWSFWIPAAVAVVYVCAAFVPARSTYVRSGWGYVFYAVSPVVILPVLALFLRFNGGRNATIGTASFLMTAYVTFMLSLGVKYVAKAVMHQVLLHLPQYRKSVVVRSTVREDGDTVKWWERVPASAPALHPERTLLLEEIQAQPIAAAAFEHGEEMAAAQNNFKIDETPAAAVAAIQEVEQQDAETAQAQATPQRSLLPALEAPEVSNETSKFLSIFTRKKEKREPVAQPEKQAGPAMPFFAHLRDSLKKTVSRAKNNEQVSSTTHKQDMTKNGELASAAKAKAAQSPFAGKGKKAIKLDETELLNREKSAAQSPFRNDREKSKGAIAKQTSVFAGKRGAKATVQIDAAELVSEHKKTAQNEKDIAEAQAQTNQLNQKTTYHAEQQETRKPLPLPAQSKEAATKKTDSFESNKQAGGANLNNQVSPITSSEAFEPDVAVATPEPAQNAAEPIAQPQKPQQQHQQGKPNQAQANAQQRKPRRKKHAGKQGNAQAKQGNAQRNVQQSRQQNGAGGNQPKNNGQQEASKNIYKPDPQNQPKSPYTGAKHSKKKKKNGKAGNRKQQGTNN